MSIKMKLGCLTFTAFLAMSAVMNASAQLLNELQTNNPGGDVSSCEFIEIRGIPGSAVGAATYLVEIEGDGAAAGIADFVRNVSLDTFGANGILTINGTDFAGVCGGRDYSKDGGNLISDPGISLENGTISFFLIQSPTTPITAGTDYDTSNDGILDGLPADAFVLDGVGWTDGTAGDLVYGSDITPDTGTPDAATRDFNNQTPLVPTAWFSGNIAGTTIDSVQYEIAGLRGPFTIGFITPGRQNLLPSSSSALIGGRAADSGGNGLRFIAIMLSGGNLEEPVYATTNNFGYYRFEGIPVGETYLLSVVSTKYIFQNSNRVVNLFHDLLNEDFIGEQPRKNTGLKADQMHPPMFELDFAPQALFHREL